MPKVKRFRNPLKSSQGPYDAHGGASLSQVVARSPALGPSISLQAPPHVASNSSPTNEVPQEEQPPPQPSNSRATSAPRIGRESTQYWNVEATDSNNAIKHIKVKVHQVNNLPVGERVIVDFDGYGAAYGEAQALLAGYCGLLAVDGNIFPINFDRWSGPSGIPKKYKEDCFETVLKPRFCFRTTDAIAYRYCNASLNKKWATHRQRLWDEFFDPSKSRNELLSNVPPGLNRDQWVGFVTYRLRQSTIELCQRNKEIRNKQTIPHTCGSKSISRRRHELFLETGQYPSRGKMYIETHKKRDGSFVNDEARTIVEQIEETQSNNNESVSPNDSIGKLFGAEHSGRVRCMGMGAAPSQTFTNTMQRLSDLNLSSSSLGASSSASTYLHQKVTRLEGTLEEVLAAWKAYMISKEGRVPEEFAGLFSPQQQSGDDLESEPTSQMDVRGLSSESNENQQTNA